MVGLFRLTSGGGGWLISVNIRGRWLVCVYWYIEVVGLFRLTSGGGGWFVSVDILRWFGFCRLASEWRWLIYVG